MVTFRRLWWLPAVTLWAACAPPSLRGRADLLLRDRLAGQAASPQAIAPLLSEQVEVARGGGTVSGVEAAASALAEVKASDSTRVLRHHQVSLLLLGGGRTLLVERGDDDRITRAVELRAPVRTDGLPRRIYFYGAAWNTDAEGPRRDLVKASYAQDGYYVDPGHEARGGDEVARMIGNLRRVAPGSVLHYTSGVAEVGGGWATGDWVMLSRPGGRVLFRGIDVMHLDAAGKIDYLAGFIGTRTPP